MELSAFTLGISQSDATALAGSDFAITSDIPGLESLCTLSLAATGQISSPSDVAISFTSNPKLGLNDAAIQSSLVSGGILSAGHFSMGGPLDFNFTISSTSSFSVTDVLDSYAADNETSVTVPVPLPPAFWPVMGTFSLMGLVSLLRKRLETFA